MWLSGNYWRLCCNFNNNDPNSLTLEEWKLVPGWRAFDVWPATNFTGVWVNYYANGQKFTEGSYTGGSRSGIFVSFFHSGRIRFQGVYSNNVQVGAWVRYSEDGSTNSVKDYSKP